MLEYWTGCLKLETWDSNLLNPEPRKNVEGNAMEMLRPDWEPKPREGWGPWWGSQLDGKKTSKETDR
jgi:hypothetical protein